MKHNLTDISWPSDPHSADIPLYPTPDRIQLSIVLSLPFYSRLVRVQYTMNGLVTMSAGLSSVLIEIGSMIFVANSGLDS